MTSLFPKVSFAQLISSSSSFCRSNLNPTKVYPIHRSPDIRHMNHRNDCL